MKPRDTELAGKGEDEFEFTFEVNITYTVEMIIGGEVHREHLNTTMLKFIVAPDSREALVLLGKEMDDNGLTITVHSYDVVAFEKEEV